MVLDLTIVIPTQGRSTIDRCLNSMTPYSQQGVSANVLVVIDTFEPVDDVSKIEAIVTDYGFSFVHHNVGYSDWGYPQLQLAYQTARTKYIMNMGDDDIFLPRSFTLLEDILNRPYEPKMVKTILNPSPHRGNKLPVVLWYEKEFVRGMVTGQNFICPNTKSAIGYWKDDFCQMEETVNNWNGRVDWIDEILTSCF